MYNMENWNGCLSFIQMSVALNFGSILVENKIRKLFDSGRSQDNSYDGECIGTIEQYREEYCEKMKTCIQRIAEKKDLDSKIYSDLNNLTSIYYKADEEFQMLNICRKLDTICFNYACLLLGIYGLVGLFVIPVTTSSDFATAFFAIFSALTSLSLVVLLAIEVMHRIKKEGIIKGPLKKYFKKEIFIILAFLTASAISATYISQSTEALDFIKLYVCDIPVILPYISFVVCFILILFDEHKYKNKNRRIQDYKKDFNRLYVGIINATNPK